MQRRILFRSSGAKETGGLSCRMACLDRCRMGIPECDDLGCHGLDGGHQSQGRGSMVTASTRCRGDCSILMAGSTGRARAACGLPPSDRILSHGCVRWTIHTRMCIGPTWKRQAAIRCAAFRTSLPAPGMPALPRTPQPRHQAGGEEAWQAARCRRQAPMCSPSRVGRVGDGWVCRPTVFFAGLLVLTGSVSARGWPPDLRPDQWGFLPCLPL